MHYYLKVTIHFSSLFYVVVTFIHSISVYGLTVWLKVKFFSDNISKSKFLLCS